MSGIIQRIEAFAVTMSAWPDSLHNYSGGLNWYLAQGWTVSDIHSIVTQQNEILVTVTFIKIQDKNDRRCKQCHRLVTQAEREIGCLEDLCWLCTLEHKRTESRIEQWLNPDAPKPGTGHDNVQHTEKQDNG